MARIASGDTALILKIVVFGEIFCLKNHGEDWYAGTLQEVRTDTEKDRKTKILPSKILPRRKFYQVKFYLDANFISTKNYWK